MVKMLQFYHFRIQPHILGEFDLDILALRGGWEMDLLHRFCEDFQVRSTDSIDVCLKPVSSFLHVKSELQIQYDQS